LLSNQDIACRFSYEVSPSDQDKGWLNLAYFRENEPISRYFSLKHGGLLRINYGDDCEEFRILTRIHDLPWSVVRLEKDRLSANFQGNPCWPQIILDSYQHLSDYLGLSQSVRENLCFVPTIATLNQKIKDLLLCAAAPLNEDLFLFCDESRYVGCTHPGLSEKIFPPKVFGNNGYTTHVIPDCHQWLARLEDQAALLNDTRKGKLLFERGRSKVFSFNQALADSIRLNIFKRLGTINCLLQSNIHWKRSSS
jgi:hypothetical protein